MSLKKNKNNNREYYFLLIAVFSFLLLSLNSCKKYKMQWARDPSYGKITVDELPLSLSEKLSRYDVIKSYADFTTGVGISSTLYMQNETYRNLVNQNFDQVTFGYAMKHGAMVSSDGSIDFSKVDPIIAKLKAAGLRVFGHTLVWQHNQNASYLNSLIAPTVIPGPAGSNLLDVSGLIDGSFNGWSKLNPGAGISIEAGAGLSDTAKALKMVSSSSSVNAWDLELGSPDIPIISGHTYEISFFIKSDKPGKGRISFSGLSNNYPWEDWYDAGGNYTEAFETNSQWQQVKFKVNDFTGNSFSMFFDLGYLPGVTYYLDVNNILVVDLDAKPTEVNYVKNGGFETGDLTNWTVLNPGAGIEVTNEEKYSGSYSVKMTSSSSSANPWDLQLESDQISLDSNKTYTFSFKVKSDVPGKGRISFPGGIDGGQEYPWLDWTGSGVSEAFTTSAGSWTSISVDLTNTSDFKLSFDMGYLPDVTYYIDDIKVVEKQGTTIVKPATNDNIVVEKSPEEKAKIIGEALKDWISKMVGHYKNDVHAWDVVNEPLNDAGGLRSGKNITNKAADDFYWQDYLGKDYAVTAFKLAREYGNSNDTLFINDYGLENSLVKCDSLIQYVKYIESKGARVDGIGTEMHVSITTDTNNIVKMFQKLGASGKLIRISEMDVKVGTKSPTPEQLAEQAHMYQFIVDAYKKYVPKNQRYGITVWGVSDNPDEHAYWLPNDAPCLWDANYERKYAYKGFCDGLAGRDVSADFSGALQY